MNTKLSILYTCANNYKAFEEFILVGSFKEEEFKQLRRLEEFFVPSELGLPNPAYAVIEESGNDDHHHGFCTLPDAESETFASFNKATLTTLEPTVNMTPRQFIDAYAASPKDAGAALGALLA